MEEVTEEQLPAYLRKLKKEGYSLVGLEQTVTSKVLGQVHLPEKMVLVLGHEKEGIPIEIIQVCSFFLTHQQILDLCVEIPQFGIIRSLNVHVSGSILLWEYISFIINIFVDLTGVHFRKQIAIRRMSLMGGLFVFSNFFHQSRFLYLSIISHNI